MKEAVDKESRVIKGKLAAIVVRTSDMEKHIIRYVELEQIL